MSVLWQFFAALPEILRLLAAIQKNQQEQEIERKVKDDIKVIHEAMLTRDSKKLNDLFKSI